MALVRKMVQLTLVSFFALILLITDISMTSHHPVAVAAYYFCLDDWVDENCEKGISIDCMEDCINKYGDTSNGFCEFYNCYCQYKCPYSPDSPNYEDSPIEPHN